MTRTLSLFLRQEADTERLGKILATKHPASAVVYLQGGLGAGKTTFSRGFIQACGHHGIVKSPTYTLIEPYVFNKVRIFHMDLYRLADPEELEYLGLDDLTKDGTISLIEWPEHGSNSLPAPDLTVSLTHRDDGREVTLTAHSAVADSWLASIGSHLKQISHHSV